MGELLDAVGIDRLLDMSEAGRSVDSGSIVLKWKTVVGRAYKIEGNVNLDPALWVELPQTVIGTGTTVSSNVDTSVTECLFFRISPIPYP